jgi:DmsE family decaheme c-type cytochrome
LAKKRNCLHNPIVSTIFYVVILTFASAYAYQSSACLDCHEEYENSLSSTSHSGTNKKVEITCLSCHIDYTDHLEEPEAGNITNPALLDPFEALDICSSCHFGKSESDFAHASSHFKANVNCSGCHKVHNANVYGVSILAQKNINETCFKCHVQEQYSFTLLSSHPVKSGAMTCIDCHDYFKNIGESFTTANKNSACYKCHTEMDGPFLYEHEANRDFGLEDGGCLSCHDPHGSAFVNLLKEPVFELCQQCHQVSSFHATAHNAKSCLECHIDIHGSDSDTHYLLSPPTSIINSAPCNLCHQ